EALGDFFEGEDGRHARVVRISCSTLSCKHLSTAHSRAWRVEDARKRAYGGESGARNRNSRAPPHGPPRRARARGPPPRGGGGGGVGGCPAGGRAELITTAASEEK